MHSLIDRLDISDFATAQLRRGDDPGGPLATLIAALDRAGIRYCHWKSNVRLPETLAGGEDIDLLVDRRDAPAFTAALSGAGFKLANSAANLGHPGVFHAFALDAPAGRLVHLHGCFQVVSGDSLVKSYRLPLEDALLAGSRRSMGVSVPSPEVELALFALRVAQAHERDRDRHGEPRLRGGRGRTHLA
jgi:hypothetical protein